MSRMQRVSEAVGRVLGGRKGDRRGFTSHGGIAKPSGKDGKE